MTGADVDHEIRAAEVRIGWARLRLTEDLAALDRLRAQRGDRAARSDPDRGAAGAIRRD